MKTDTFITLVREMPAHRVYFEEPVEELLPIVEEIETLRDLERAVRGFLHRDVGEPTADLAEALEKLDRLER